MCNQNITFRELPPVPVSNEFQKDGSESGFNYTYLIIFAAVGVALVLLAMILFKMNKNHNEKMKRLPFNAGDNELDGLFARPIGDSTLRNEFNNGQDFSCEVTSGSGSGNISPIFFDILTTIFFLFVRNFFRILKWTFIKSSFFEKTTKL